MKRLNSRIKELCIVPETRRGIKQQIKGYGDAEIDEEIDRLLEQGTLFKPSEDKIGMTSSR